MPKKIPNIVLFLVVAILIILGVYLYFRTKESAAKAKNAEAGNWFANLFSSNAS